MIATPKRHILARNRVFWYILRQNRSRGLGCSELQLARTQKNGKTEKRKTGKTNTFWCAKSHMRGNETPGWIVTNFCTGVGVHDVITSANFYDCRLWGLSVVGGQILAFSIDLRRRSWPVCCLTSQLLSTQRTMTVNNRL